MNKTSKPNVSALSRKHGISRATLIAWRDTEGINLNDDAAVRSRASQVASKVANNADLKRERLRKLRGEADKIEAENKVRSGDLISRAQAQQSAMAVASTARARLLQTANTLPPRLAGLDEARIQAMLRAEYIEILTELSDPKSYLPQGN